MDGSEPAVGAGDSPFRDRSQGFHGEVIHVEAEAPVSLGGGYSVLAGAPRASALRLPMEIETEDDFQVRYSVNYAEDSRELASKLGIRASAKASWGTGSASGKMSLTRETRSHQYSGYLIVQAEALRRTELLKEGRFRDEALGLLEESPERFYATYGDSFVFRRAWGADLAAVLEVQARRYETKEDFSASMRASQGTFSASASVETSLKEKLKNRNVRVVYAQRGAFHGRPVCLDARSGGEESCSQWPRENTSANGSPSRGGVVTLTLEELIIRLRDFGQEVWEHPETADLVGFDVLDYSAIPNRGKVELFDRVETERAMEDLGEIYLVLRDRLEDVRFALDNRQEVFLASDDRNPSVVLPGEIYELLPWLEWVYSSGLEIVRECLEDRSRLVGTECLEDARAFYETTPFGGLSRDFTIAEELDGCDVLPDPASEVSISSGFWIDAAGRPCMERFVSRWAVDDETRSVTLRDPKDDDVTPVSNLSAAAALEAVQAVAYSPQDLVEELENWAQRSALELPAVQPVSPGIPGLLDLREDLRQSRACELAAASMKQRPDDLIRCLLAHRLTLVVPQRPDEACKGENYHVARGHVVHVPRRGRNSSRRNANRRAARVVITPPEGQKVKLCTGAKATHVMAKIHKSRVFSRRQPGHDGDWWALGGLGQRKSGRSTIYELEVLNWRKSYGVSAYLEVHYGLESAR